MDKELQLKYSKALQEVQKERNELRQQLAIKDKAFELCYEKLEYIARNYTNLVMIPSKEHFKTKAKEMVER